MRSLFGKDSGRTYTHGTVSWASGEITHEEAAAFAKDYLPQIYPEHQVIFAVHTDTDHIHFHFVVNPVSYLDGSMLHWSKHDLEKAKQICNEMCLQRGWQVAKKGHHYDGTAFADGEITAWRKDKWHQMERAPEKSYLVDLALAVQDCTAAVCNREDFCTMMEQEYGWNVIWKDTKKNITFTDCEGHRVRDSNLKKTFSLKTSKEELEHEFAKNIGKQTYNPKTIERKSATKGADLTLGSGKQLAERTAGNHSKSRR